MEKSKQYNKTKLLINLISNFANIFLMYILGFSKIYESIENSENFISLLQYIGVTFFVIWLINIPFGYYSGYYLEKKYQLSNENNLDWIKRQLKSFVLGIILGGVIFIMIRYFLFYAKEHWWIYVFIFMICFNILLGMLAPVIIFPLFYKFEPLENEDLETKIFDLAKKGNVKIKSILRFNMSKETKKANAAFTGIGKTKRIIIGDTLLDEFTEDEIVAVFAHEQGHLVKKHILKMIFIYQKPLPWHP